MTRRHSTTDKHGTAWAEKWKKDPHGQWHCTIEPEGAVWIPKGFELLRLYGKWLGPANATVAMRVMAEAVAFIHDGKWQEGEAE